jgi:hypothetical protein
MVCFETKKTNNLGKFWRALDWKMICISWSFGILYGHLGYFMTIWYIFPVLVSCPKKTSGNPERKVFD